VMVGLPRAVGRRQRRPAGARALGGSRSVIRW